MPKRSKKQRSFWRRHFGELTIALFALTFTAELTKEIAKDAWRGTKDAVVIGWQALPSLPSRYNTSWDTGSDFGSSFFSPKKSYDALGAFYGDSLGALYGDSFGGRLTKQSFYRSDLGSDWYVSDPGSDWYESDLGSGRA